MGHKKKRNQTNQNIKETTETDILSWQEREEQKVFESILQISSCWGEEEKMTQKILESIPKDPSISISIKDGNIIVTKGRIGVNEYFPTVCCHIDTVFNTTDSGVINVLREDHKKGEFIYSSPTGIGGDDKCGIFSCLQLLKKEKSIKAIFFSGEEIGMVGANNIDLEEFDDVGYLIELDRKGGNDIIMIHYGKNMVSPVFLQKIENLLTKEGYKQAEGIGTDVSSLQERGLDISAVNISCGYYNPHLVSEFIKYSEVLNGISLAEKMISKLGKQRYAGIENANNKKFFIVSNTRSIFMESGDLYECMFCGTYGDEREMSFSTYGEVCNECLDSMVSSYIES